jgi:hypothetical protein
MAETAIGMAVIPLAMARTLEAGRIPDIRFVCAFQVVRRGRFGSLERVSVEESGKKWTKVEEGC